MSFAGDFVSHENVIWRVVGMVPAVGRGLQDGYQCSSSLSAAGSTWSFAAALSSC